MDRRDFLKICSLAGLGVASLGVPGTIRSARAAGPKFWVFVNANGGWDPTMLCDPKGNEKNDEGFIVNNFGPEAIKTAGAISYPEIGNNKPFFDRFKDICTVINGVDCETNGHDSGIRNAFSGRLNINTPALPALLALALNPELPMSFITNGGYDDTDGIIASTRLGNAGDTLQALVHPNLVSINNQNFDDSPKYFETEALKLVHEAQSQRLLALQEKQNLPRQQAAMSMLYTSRLGMADMKKIRDEMATIDMVVKDFGKYGSGQGLARQAQVAIAAYKAGLSQSVNLSVGGFDTHSNHDQNQQNALDALRSGVMALFDIAEAAKCADDLFVVVGSDFGRTPMYNDGNGKDHWSVGSMLLLSVDHIKGNRVIGGTDATFRYEKLDFDKLEVGGGSVLKPGHVHKWLRKFAGIDEHPIVRRYPINVKGEIDLG
ncbi:MAG: DUF1501 domain-containing protein [Deltaproteobacteria bacterium]|nr:DUF1501 domain-containing protein [Deltaproteobacteria bacterium]